MAGESCCTHPVNADWVEYRVGTRYGGLRGCALGRRRGVDGPERVVILHPAPPDDGLAAHVGTEEQVDLNRARGLDPGHSHAVGLESLAADGSGVGQAHVGGKHGLGCEPLTRGEMRTRFWKRGSFCGVPSVQLNTMRQTLTFWMGRSWMLLRKRC